MTRQKSAPPPPDPYWLTAPQAARILGISRGHLYRYATRDADGRITGWDIPTPGGGTTHIQAVHIGNRAARIPRNQLNQALEAQT